MNMDSSTSESLPPLTSLEESARARPKILEGLGSRVTIWGHFLAKKARNLPIIGLPIGYVEDSLSRWLAPVISMAEEDGLFFLSLIDDQIHAMSDVAMAHSALASKVIPHLQTILSGEPIEIVLSSLDKLRTRGVIGSTADIWVEYEPLVKDRSQYIYNMAYRVPLLRFAAFILHEVMIPLVSLASDWLLKHSEIKDKHQITLVPDVSPSPPDSTTTPDKSTKISDKMEFEYDSATEQGTAKHPPSDVADPVASEFTGATGYAGGEIDVLPAKGGDQEPEAGGDSRGKSPDLAVLYEDEEEHDEVTELFDTWGMGVKAISPVGLKSIRNASSRSQPLKEGKSGQKKGGITPITLLSKSLKF